MRRLLLLASGVTACLSLFWGGFFLLRGAWLTAALDGLAIAIAVGAVWLTLRGHLGAASRLVIGMLYCLLVLNTVVFDIPSAEVPRSAHQFLLALAVVSCLLTRGEPPWLRHGVPLLCFATYVVLASTNTGFVTSLALPDSVRATGVWINQAVALATVYAALHVIQSDVAERDGLHTELRDGLLHGEMLLHYQPQVDAAGRTFGAEALVRWRHPQRGLVPPGEFIPLAERSGLMVPLGEGVLRTACAQLVAWQQRPQTAMLVLAVNVSAMQFVQPDFVARVLAIVHAAGADPRRLKLELTESVLANDIDDLVAKMSALKAHGIGFSLDDFGTGFSSLSYLRRLPLDQLKIDQSFVRALGCTAEDSAIAQAVVQLGRTLGLHVIAEGVETTGQRALLAGIGCEAYQGYLFGRPMPINEFEAWLAVRHAATSTPWSERPVAARAAAAEASFI